MKGNQDVQSDSEDEMLSLLSQDLYQSELKSKDKLANRLYKANEKMAESQALLK